MRGTRAIALLTLAVGMLTGCAKADVAQLLEQYQWEKRLIFVFAPAVEDAALKQQLQWLRADASGMAERDTLQWVVVHDAFVTLDATPYPQLGTRAFYRHFNIAPDAFTVLLIGKDGEEKFRSSSPVKAARFAAIIDRMPMRQREATTHHTGREGSPSP